jgi:hypothetical protein
MWHQVSQAFKQSDIATKYFELRSIACNSEELSFDHPTMKFLMMVRLLFCHLLRIAEKEATLKF